MELAGAPLVQAVLEKPKNRLSKVTTLSLELLVLKRGDRDVVTYAGCDVVTKGAARREADPEDVVAPALD